MKTIETFWVECLAIQTDMWLVCFMLFISTKFKYNCRCLKFSIHNLFSWVLRGTISCNFTPLICVYIDNAFETLGPLGFLFPNQIQYFELEKIKKFASDRIWKFNETVSLRERTFGMSRRDCDVDEGSFQRS